MGSTIHQAFTDAAVDVGVASECGRDRQQNQDSFLIDDDLQLCIIADGVGSRAGGAVASRMACQHLADLLAATFETLRLHGSTDPADRQDIIQAALARSFQSADRRIVCEQALHPRLAGMATTALVACIDSPEPLLSENPQPLQLHVGHVGDSRAVLLRRGVPVPLTRVHNLAAGLLEAGVITSQQAACHPGRHTLYLFLGGELHDGPALTTCPVFEGDRILLMTDGISDVLDDSSIARLLDSIANPEIAAACVVDEAMRRGSRDDATCVVINVGE